MVGKYSWILIVFLIIILIPMALEYLFFSNGYLSKVSNDGWASFFGSYFGGILGGIGTLVAVLISTRQTDKIQKRNEEISEQIRKETKEKYRKDFINHKTELYNQRQFDTDLFRKEQTEKFCIDIQETMAAYYADICRYAQDCHKEMQLCKNAINEKVHVNRLISIQMRFLLHVKLDGIPEATDLLKELDSVHRLAGDAENYTLAEILDRINGLIGLTRKFVKDYKNR